MRRLIQDPDFLTNQDFTEPLNLAPTFFGWEIFRTPHEANQKIVPNFSPSSHLKRQVSYFLGNFTPKTSNYLP